MNKDNYKVTPVYTCYILFNSPAGQTITKKLKSSKKVCELAAPVVCSVDSSGACSFCSLVPTVRFLIAYSMQQWREKLVTCMVM